MSESIQEQIDAFNEAMESLPEEDKSTIEELTRELKAELVESTSRYPFEVVLAAYSKCMLWLYEQCEDSEEATEE